MLFTGVMVMTMMDTASVLSSPEVEEEVVVEVEVVAAEHREDPREGGMVPHLDARSTEL